jgi:predicted glutamine amidotransferase
MCRLFGQHAHPDFDRCEPLCTARNALRFQSHAHPHGWGIGWYERGRPHVRRGLLPAHADGGFVRAAREARSRIVIAHVRDASVGPVTRENTHPFVHGPWLFAHNGTLARFKKVRRVRDALEDAIAPPLREALRGDTDSERLFHLFLTCLPARIRGGGATLGEVHRALAEATEIASRIADAPGATPSSLNFVVSDGRILAACRRGRPLHAATGAGARQAFVVASERIGEGAWEEIPEGGFVGTDDGARLVRAPLAVPRLAAAAP